MGARTVLSIAEGAKAAQRELARVGGAKRSEALTAISAALRANVETILEANRQDTAAARENGMAESMIDRLTLTPERIESMAKGVDDVAAMPDPVGRVISGTTRPNGLKIEKVSVPLGVIGIIYEARPNVTSDAAALCLKAGNAVILRGGKEAIRSNTAVMELMRGAVREVGLPENVVNLIEDTSRESAGELMRMNGLVDVLIPRGGAGLIKSVVQNSTVPVIETGSGNCHIYIDEFADIDMAADIVFNAKTSRPSVCNACESVLIHKAVAEKAIVAVAGRLSEKDVEIYGDEVVCAALDFAKPAAQDDWGREYLDYKISIKTVDSIDEAIAHIAKYSTGHSESIITEDYKNAQKFLNEVDSAAVYVNASTRFTDGGEFGFGAEIGISTQKLHARGPLGLNNLTSEKYIVYGSGQIR
ncbi:MAG: glutamate-5-semialdehyde dehydrogenase [Acutalibacteraceae bacterium]